MALARTGRLLYGRLVARTFIELMRNLPPLVIIFLFYFFLADQMIPLLRFDGFAATLSAGSQAVVATLLGPVEQLPALLAAIITLAVFESAYVAEILRAGIESIGRPQWDAAQALGPIGASVCGMSSCHRRFDGRCRRWLAR